MQNRKTTQYNRYFLAPFLVWLVVGGLLQLFFTQEQLFAAFNTHYSAIGDKIMYFDTWLGEGLAITVLLLLIWLLPPFRNLWYFTAAALCNLLPFFLQQWLKSVFDMPRPLNYFHQAQWIHIAPEWPVLMSRSFPSGHSEGAFSFFCFLSLLLPERHQKYGLLFFLLALSVGYSRMYLSAHFFEDVYTGSIIGAVGTLLVFMLVNRYRTKFTLPKQKK